MFFLWSRGEPAIGERSTAAGSPEDSSQASQFGDWMVVQRRRRRHIPGNWRRTGAEEESKQTSVNGGITGSSHLVGERSARVVKNNFNRKISGNSVKSRSIPAKKGTVTK